VIERWSGLQLRHLETLRAIAAERSFHAAAERLSYTQSAVSQQLRALELIVGVRLVERPRGRQRVSLTPAGRILVEHAAAIAARLGAARADLGSLSRGDAGLLRVGAYPSVAAGLLPELLRAFTSARPRVELDLVEAANDADLLALLEQGELDVAFVDLPLPRGRCQAVQLLEDPYVLVVGAESPLALAAKPPSILEVARLPLVCFKAPCRSIERVLAHIAAHGVEPRVVLRTEQNDVLQALAANGLGVALMPRLAVDEFDSSTAIVDLGQLLPPRTIAIAWHAERRHTPLVRAFVQTAQGVVRAGDEAERCASG
jgi:DNA-binding transcriptional LysR family regulator